MTFFDFIVFHSDRKSFFCSYEDDEFFSSRHACVKKVAVEHLEMARMDGNHDTRAFAALVFMDRYRIR